MQFQKRGLIEIVEANIVSYDKTGHIVQNVGHLEDKWFIDAETFERTYGEVQDIIGDFGWAIRRLKSGARVTRRGWNGKGMWLVLVTSNHWGMGSDIPFDWGKQGKDLQPWIGMKTAQNMFVPWFSAQSDMLGEDWEECEDGE